MDDPDRRADWIREPPARAITDEERFPWFRRRMEFEELVPAFGEWYAGGEGCAQLVGIRTQESLNRWRTLASESKGTLDGMKWTTHQPSGVFSAFPIYDWKTEDIWTYHARFPDRPHNELYDRMQLAGLTIHQQRICQPYGDDQRKGLWLFHVIEPETWARVVARVNGANQGALYATERGNILGRIKIDKPEGHTWESFANLLIDSMPQPAAEHYRNKVAVFIRWWQLRGYERGIPDEAPADAEAKRAMPSWRRVCKALLRNDYWCKGLSFSQQKGDGKTYDRYRAIMRQRRQTWGIYKPSGHPNYGREPTVEQLAMLAALTGGSTVGQGWKAIGAALGLSASSAVRRATKRDASKAIEIIKTTGPEIKKEFRCRA